MRCKHGLPRNVWSNGQSGTALSNTQANSMCGYLNFCVYLLKFKRKIFSSSITLYRFQMLWKVYTFEEGQKSLNKTYTHSISHITLALVILGCNCQYFSATHKEPSNPMMASVMDFCPPYTWGPPRCYQLTRLFFFQIKKKKKRASQALCSFTHLLPLVALGLPGYPWVLSSWGA